MLGTQRSPLISYRSFLARCLELINALRRTTQHPPPPRCQAQPPASSHVHAVYDMASVLPSAISANIIWSWPNHVAKQRLTGPLHAPLNLPENTSGRTAQHVVPPGTGVPVAWLIGLSADGMPGPPVFMRSSAR